jgi:hypothetical protein
MGAWLDAWKRKKEARQPAEAGGVGRARAGGPDGENRGGGEATDRWVLVTLLAI